MQFLRQQTKWACLVATVTVSLGVIQAQVPAGMMPAEQKVIDYQYRFGSIDIPVASAHEPTRSSLSLDRALDYIENGAEAWSKHRKCVSCHTTGTYMVIRPVLTPYVGKPSLEMRDFFVEQFDEMRHLNESQPQQLRSGTGPTQMAYIAGGLARWDAHVSHQLSSETEAALRFMFELQSEDGSWSNDHCWPPFESSAYQGATVAARAAAAAPGWLENLQDESLLTAVQKMKTYLAQTRPPHDYARVLLLWAATHIPDLVDEPRKQELVEMIWKHQRPDGGWSLRTFATPDTWGDGSRAKKLRDEPEFQNPASDGHQTGLAVIVLRDAGVPAQDPRIQRAVQWLLTHQRQSGRWWTRSLNTDKWHFITYSGTCYPLLALAKCGALPPLRTTAETSR